jgi:hypothetical protein
MSSMFLSPDRESKCTKQLISTFLFIEMIYTRNESPGPGAYDDLEGMKKIKP